MPRIRGPLELIPALLDAQDSWARFLRSYMTRIPGLLDAQDFWVLDFQEPGLLDPQDSRFQGS